jgi:chloride channel protein, CIC family
VRLDGSGTLRRWVGATTRTMRFSPGGGLALALLVGAGAGGGAIVFRWLVVSFTELFTGYADYAGRGHEGSPRWPGLGPYFVLITPVLAGLVYGPLVHLFAREARGHGVPEVMYAVARRGGRIKPQVALVKALASALTIGGGGSVGREGPIVQIGSALGSTVGALVRAPESRMRVLVACGASGGIAATFNAPLAGVFFAMELILRDFAAGSFAMVVISSVTASVIGRAALGDHPFLALPAFGVQHLGQYLLFALLGVLAGVVGVAFAKVLYLIEDLCDRVWRWPEWLRPAVGGVLLGGLLLALPEMYGVGYPVLDNSIGGVYVVGFLLVLLAGKIVATSLTIGIGGSGGVFAPSLFIGAMLGAAYGQVVQTIDPGLAGPPGAYALIGMGAVFAGAARAPITAVIIMFELTGEYTIILPLMAAIVVATGMSRLLSRDTIYTKKLRRRGIDLDEPASTTALRATLVEHVLETGGRQIPEATPLPVVADLLAASPGRALVVLDDDDRYLGVVTAVDVARALSQDSGRSDAATTITRALPTVTGDFTVQEALTAIETAGVPAVPVLTTDGAFRGWLTLQGVLGVLHPPHREPGGRGTP